MISNKTVKKLNILRKVGLHETLYITAMIEGKPADYHPRQFTTLKSIDIKSWSNWVEGYGTQGYGWEE